MLVFGRRAGRYTRCLCEKGTLLWWESALQWTPGDPADSQVSPYSPAGSWEILTHQNLLTKSLLLSNQCQKAPEVPGTETLLGKLSAVPCSGKGILALQFPVTHLLPPHNCPTEPRARSSCFQFALWWLCPVLGTLQELPVLQWQHLTFQISGLQEHQTLEIQDLHAEEFMDFLPGLMAKNKGTMQRKTTHETSPGVLAEARVHLRNSLQKCQTFNSWLFLLVTN